MAQKCTIDQIKKSLTELQYQLDDIKEFKDLDARIQSNKANEEPVEEKRQSSSWWGWIGEKVKKGLKVNRETSTHTSDIGEGSQGGSRMIKRNSRQDQEDASLEILKLQNDIRQMKAAFEKLDNFQGSISKSLKTEVPPNKLKAILSKTDSVKSQARDLKEIRRKVLNLKGQIPSLLKKQSSIGLSIKDSQTAEENGEIVETGRDVSLPALHAETESSNTSLDFEHSSAFEEVVDTFKVLEFKQKLCFLSFAVFPENKEVKKTMLMYWWIGEGFIRYEESEDKVTRILDEFSRKGLIEAVEDERKIKPSGYKMEPHVHAAVVYLARRMELFDLYSKGKLTMKRSGRNNVCLVKRSSLQPEAKASKMQPKDLNSVFNSSERYPDFTFKWFPEMESLKVLYLGRWERTATRHIEVESTKFLKDMKSLKNLRLASFQGISRIESLKDLTFSLPELVILDLRACYNLEGLPKDIDSLGSLVYLDVSECYMLDRMPPEISRLERLQVLKGFVISQSDDEKDCAVKQLKNLRKLSITVNRYEFEVDGFLDSLKDLTKLESLKIAWGARFRDEDGGKVEETDKEKTGKHKDSKDGEDDQAHKKGQTNGEKKKEDGNKKDNIEEEKKKDEVNAESLKSDEGDKGNAAHEEGKKVKEDKGKVATEEEEGKKQDKVDGVEGVEKASTTNTIENKKKDDKKEKTIDGEKEKVNPEEEGKKKDEVKEVISKPEDEKTSPPQESKETVKSKPDEGDKQEKNRDGEKDKTEGEKKDELKAENSEPGKVDKKISPPQESKDKPDDHQGGEIQEEKRDAEKDIIEEEKKKHEVKAENSKPEKVDEKTSPPQESKDTVTSKPDNHHIQEEKRDGENYIIEEEKKKDEVTSPAQQSKDTIQSMPNDHKENNSKVQDKGDGEKIKAALKKPDDGKTHKLDKNKLDKKVSFSEEPRAAVQKKPATKESGSRIPKLFTMTRTATKKLVKGKQEDSRIETSKLPSSLKKLELECYPKKEPPVWLNPKTLENLTKLSIKGGNLSKFSDEPLNAENKCGVEILRLKYLHEFKAEWTKLHALFPKLKLLEKFKCPEVAFCPTDGNGVWRSQP